MGRQLYQRVATPLVVWGLAPSGVEIAAAAAEAMEQLEAAFERTRRAIKRERLLFRGRRTIGNVSDGSVVIIDGHVTAPWKFFAAAKCAGAMKPTRVAIAAAVATRVVHDTIRTRRWEFVCPSVVMDREGHHRPFGDSRDPSAERLRSIVVARQAA